MVYIDMVHKVVIMVRRARMLRDVMSNLKDGGKSI